MRMTQRFQGLSQENRTKGSVGLTVAILTLIVAILTLVVAILALFTDIFPSVLTRLTSDPKPDAPERHIEMGNLDIPGNATINIDQGDKTIINSESKRQIENLIDYYEDRYPRLLKWLQDNETKLKPQPEMPSKNLEREHKNIINALKKENLILASNIHARVTDRIARDFPNVSLDSKPIYAIEYLTNLNELLKLLREEGTIEALQMGSREDQPAPSIPQPSDRPIITESNVGTPQARPSTPSIIGESEPYSQRRVGLEGASNINNFIKYAEMLPCKVIIYRGDEVSHSDFNIRRLTTEVIPIYVAPSRKIKSLSSQQVRAILAGEITDWSAVGGVPGPIHIHRRLNAQHGAMLAHFLRIENIQAQAPKHRMGQPPASYPEPYESDPTLDPVEDAHKESVPSYKALTANATTDPYAFVFGMSGMDPKELVMITVDHVSLIDIDATTRYPFKVPIYIAVRKHSEEAQELEQLYLSKIQERREIDARILDHIRQRQT